MVSINKVMLGGYLTADPESRSVGNGSVCHFTIAINRSWTDKASGQKKEEATFVECEAWGKTAEIAQNYLKKGKPTFVEGRLKLDRWETPEGQKRSKMKVNVDAIQFLDSGSGGGGNGAQEQQGGETQQATEPAQQGAPGYDPTVSF